MTDDDDLRHALDDLLSPLPPLGPLPASTATRVRRRRSAKLAGSAALAVALTTGGAVLALPQPLDERLQPPEVATSPTAEPSTSPTTSPTASATPQPTAAPEPSTPECEVECGEQRRTSLLPDGLAVLTLPADSTQTLLFGQATGDEVRSALGASLGDVDEAPLPDCGAQVVQLSYGDAVTVVLDGDVLVGWSADADGPVLSTSEGISAGRSLAELRAAYPSLEVSDGSLGREFTVPGSYYGVLDGPGEDAQVDVLAAGNACFR